MWGHQIHGQRWAECHPTSIQSDCGDCCEEYAEQLSNFKDGIKEVVKSYAEVTEQSQKKTIQHAAAANSSKVVVENFMRKLDDD